ncbi:MAG: glycosyltransferase family 39 protein [Polyangiaceae bacterium]
MTKPSRRERDDPRNDASDNDTRAAAPSSPAFFDAQAPLFAALLASALLLVVRLYAAQHIGFGDAEALYACYARHPQPVYLDHPGLIGVAARIIGGGSPPSPVAAHRITAVLCTVAPWAGALAARAAGVSPTTSAVAALALLLAPEISIGLFGLTPDLLLILFWYTSVAASLWAITARPGSLRALLGALASGAAAGLACDSKVSGALLLAGLALAWGSRHASAHRRTAAPWAALVVALIVVFPVVAEEIERGFPMLRHRLVDTQKEAGLSLRNLGAVLGGQLLYVTPPLLLGAYSVARDLHRRRHDDAIAYTLWSVTVAALPLLPLCLVSRVAEPHWIAPLYLALPIHLARRSPFLHPTLVKAALATSAIALTFAHAWVLLPIGPTLLGQKYEPRYDLANDLFAWKKTLPVVREALEESASDTPPIVVGPHWTVCAQVHAALPGSVLVGCRGDIRDDFADWLPSSTWEKAPTLLFVSDDRFPIPLDLLHRRRVDSTWTAEVRRGGVVVRRAIIWRLVASAVTLSVPADRGTRETTF